MNNFNYVFGMLHLAKKQYQIVDKKATTTANHLDDYFTLFILLGIVCFVPYESISKRVYQNLNYNQH